MAQDFVNLLADLKEEEVIAADEEETCVKRRPP